MTKFSDLPVDFQIGNRHQATGDRPVILYNPKNDRLLFDDDGAGGNPAKKFGKITADIIPDDPGSLSVLPSIVDQCEFIYGNRHSSEQPIPTIIANTNNGRLLFDVDGIGPENAIKIGHFDLEF